MFTEHKRLTTLWWLCKLYVNEHHLMPEETFGETRKVPGYFADGKISKTKYSTQKKEKRKQSRKKRKKKKKKEKEVRKEKEKQNKPSFPKRT